MTIEERIFPDVSDRVKSLFIDNVFLIFAMTVISSVFSKYENTPEFLKIIAFVTLFIIYDPLLTSLFGGTIGHKMIGLRVKSEQNEEKNIQFHFAILRYVLKVFLGIFSLLSVSSNPKKRAIHDLIASSVVVYKKR